MPTGLCDSPYYFYNYVLPNLEVIHLDYGSGIIAPVVVYKE